MSNQHIGAADFEPDHHRGYAFGDFVLDLDRCALLKSGEDTGLPRRAVQVLALLVEHQGVPVGEAELREHVWGDASVDSDEIAGCVTSAREKLVNGDVVLRSLPGGQYVFEQTVQPLEELAIAPRLDKRNNMETWAMILIALIVLMFIGLKVLDSGKGDSAARPSAIEEQTRDNGV